MTFPASRLRNFPQRSSGKAAALLLTLLLLPAIHAAAWDDEATKLAYSLQWDKGVVIVLNHRDRKYGTGWFIDPRYVVTAKHVIGDSSNTQIEIVKGGFHTGARVVALDNQHDIAILELEQPYREAHIFPLKPEPRKGEKIYVIGFPYELAILQGYDWERISMNPRAATGTASWFDQRRLLIEIGTYTDAGNSGGPVVDEDGNAVGLITFALEGEAATLYFATAASKVIDLCRQHNIPFTQAKINESMDDFVTNPSSLDYRIKYMMLGAGAVAIAAIVVPLVLARRR